MKKLLTYTFILLMIFSCKTKNNNSTIQGEIFIKLIDVRNIVSNIPDNKLEEVKKVLQTLIKQILLNLKKNQIIILKFY